MPSSGSIIMASEGNCHALILAVRQHGADVNEVNLEQSQPLSGFMCKAPPCIKYRVRGPKQDLIGTGILHFDKQGSEPADAVIDVTLKSRDLVESDCWMR